MNITNSQIANINIKLIPSTSNYEKEVILKFFKGVRGKRNKEFAACIKILCFHELFVQRTTNQGSRW